MDERGDPAARAIRFVIVARAMRAMG